MWNLVTLACVVLTAPSLQSARMDRALSAAAAEITAADPSITCTRSTAPRGFHCMQSLPSGRHAMLAVEVTSARARMRKDAIAIDNTLIGPGGASTRYRGQTRDRHYDIAVTQSERLGAADRAHLTPGPALIARIATLYAADRAAH